MATAAAYRAAEELDRKAGLAEIAGEEAIKAASKVTGMLSERVDEAGREAKETAVKGFETAEKTRKKAELADITGDEATEAAMRAFQQFVSNAEEAARQTRETAEAAIRAAAEETASRVEEARRSAEELARQVREAADMAANEAIRKAEEALAKAAEALPAKLVKKIISSWTFLGALILVFVCAVFAAVAISIGVSFIGQ